MAVEQPTEPERLPCGNELDTLIAHMRAGALTEHERRCPHCRTAAQRHRPLIDAEAEAERAQSGAPPELLGRVMRVVRAEGRSSALIPLRDQGPGVTRVRDTTAARIMRSACESIPGFTVGRCRVTEAEGGEGFIVTMTARVSAETPIPEVTRAARSAVLAAARDQLGWTLARVEIEVTDLD